MYYVVSASVLCIVYVYSILYLASMYYVLLAFILCVLCTLSISHLTIPVVSILPRFGRHNDTQACCPDREFRSQPRAVPGLGPRADPVSMINELFSPEMSQRQRISQKEHLESSQTDSDGCVCICVCIGLYVCVLCR